MQLEKYRVSVVGGWIGAYAQRAKIFPSLKDVLQPYNKAAGDAREETVERFRSFFSRKGIKRVNR